MIGEGGMFGASGATALFCWNLKRDLKTNPANKNVGGVRIGASLMSKDYSAFFSKLLTWL